MTRLTPAYAGNINTYLEDDAIQQAHPRIRGEYILNLPLFDNTSGSPPHTRGISERPFDVSLRIGLTPAYAGNMRNHSEGHAGQQAHPRIRGEYFAAFSVLHPFTGSPPHTRGILGGWQTGGFATGLTPAYAGNIY